MTWYPYWIEIALFARVGQEAEFEKVARLIYCIIYHYGTPYNENAEEIIEHIGRNLKDFHFYVQTRDDCIKLPYDRTNIVTALTNPDKRSDHMLTDTNRTVPEDVGLLNPNYSFFFVSFTNNFLGVEKSIFTSLPFKSADPKQENFDEELAEIGHLAQYYNFGAGSKPKIEDWTRRMIKYCSHLRDSEEEEREDYHFTIPPGAPFEAFDEAEIEFLTPDKILAFLERAEEYDEDWTRRMIKYCSHAQGSEEEEGVDYHFTIHSGSPFEAFNEVELERAEEYDKDMNKLNDSYNYALPTTLRPDF